MTAAAVAAGAERELRELYTRYKGLALATSAALILDESLGALLEEADALVEDCRTAVLPAELEVQLEACAAAAADLRGLLVLAADDPASVSAAAIQSVRATHSRLRREVWKVLPCEYVPCSASHAHELER